MNQILAQLSAPNEAGESGGARGLMMLPTSYACNAPKAKKMTVGIRQEDVGDDVDSGDWMKGIEAEWEDSEQFNRLLAQEANEKVFAATSKLPTSGEPHKLFFKGEQALERDSVEEQREWERMHNPKVKTQDVAHILKKAKMDLVNEPDFFEDDCVVEETDPDEPYPKH